MLVQPGVSIWLRIDKNKLLNSTHLNDPILHVLIGQNLFRIKKIAKLEISITFFSNWVKIRQKVERTIVA